MIDLEELTELLTNAAPGPVCAHPNGTSSWTGAEYDMSGKEDQSILLKTAIPSKDAFAEMELYVALRNAFPLMAQELRTLRAIVGLYRNASGTYTGETFEEVRDRIEASIRSLAEKDPTP